MKQDANTTATILLVEDDEGLSELLQEEIEDAGYACQAVHTAEDAIQVATTWRPDLIVTDLRLPGADGLALMRNVQAGMLQDRPDFLIITAFGTVAKAVESVKAGAEDFLTKPLDLEHLRLSISRILEKRQMRQQLACYKELLGGDSTFHGMYGQSRSMLALFDQIQHVARADGPVLIMGESGTGKELVARAIHRESGGENAPFLAVNCAGIPEHLLESEFFGHEAGAFTGATKARQGLFKEAEGGTLLLDEIAEMPPALQAKLLRMLQDGHIRPVGSNHEIRVDMRILAATHRNLDEEVQSGTFREDLFYRLETFPLRIPPLRERGDDIDLLCGIFLKKHASAAGKRITGIDARAHQLLRRYPFPGNVRELQNSIERAVAFCHDREIGPEHLPARIREASATTRKLPDPLAAISSAINDDSLPHLADIERHYIQYVLDKVDGNKRMAASILGIARRTLYRRLEECVD